ncbi:MAG TPA: VIT and VWA domain-containing protein [Caldimonas sp.]|nr:VIT and VWA domain-containing protein [Caldimonas sp.]
MNHHDETQGFGLTCVEPGAPAPVLAGVQASGRLDGVLFELTLRQTYRNASSRVLEVVYTFPLPHQSVLLGFASELNGERKPGSILARRQAEGRYEEALAEGDAPVMLEALDGGLHTANIGNLKPGDEIVLEVRFAQLLAFEQGRLRLAIPTTIAPRYGNAEQAGLQPQQVPQASLEAEYKLALSVTVAGALAGGTVESATHTFTRETVQDGIRLSLADGARLDRDVVIVVQPREPLPSLVVQARDTVSPDVPVVMMAALQPPVAEQRERLALKLLVDCSGSMAGDSIDSARDALKGALAALGENDQLSISRFGSTVEHLQAPVACTPRVLRLLGQAVNGIQADLGGTEMEGALRAVFGLPMKADAIGADVLLITDGQIWQAEEMIAAARASGHRVFAIGVGSSPAEGVLRALAEATGGACEFATPGEALEAAAQRMLVRIRQQPWRDVRIDWGAETAWQTTLPASVFGGDTVVAFAGVAARTASAVRLLAKNTGGETIEISRGEADAPCPGDSLARIAAARRMVVADEPEALGLAINYQLLSQQTHCILVHERAEADKVKGEAELHCVNSMLAAGWGATGAVRAPMAAAYQISRLARPQFARSVSVSDFHLSIASLEVEDSGSVWADSADKEIASLEVIARAVADHLDGGGQVSDLGLNCGPLRMDTDACSALDQAAAIGASDGQALVLLAWWANSRPQGIGSASIAAALQPHVDALAGSLVSQCVELFERILGGHADSGRSVSRATRLRRSLLRAFAPGNSRT